MVKEEKATRLPGDKRIFNVGAVIAFKARNELPHTRRAHKSAQ